jgi:serine/threonine protein kinase
MVFSNSKSGWRVVAHHAGAGGTLQDRISLGVLLGAGSFGRVYKGRWQGRDVAVKVMQHDAHTAARVANEASLMMSFRHPNTVQAFDFITWTHTRAADAEAPGAAEREGPTGRDTIQHAAPPAAASPAPAKPAGAAAAAHAPAGEDSAEAVVGRAPAHVAPAPRRLSVEDSGYGLRQPSGSSGTGGGSSRLAAAGSAAPADATDGISYIPVAGADLLPQASTAAVNSGSSNSSPPAATGSAQQQEGPSRQAAAATLATASVPPNDSASGSLQRFQGSNSEAQTWLIVEYCDEGTLADASKRGQLALPDGTPHVAKILVRLHEIASGMNYLHSRSVLHGDLKVGWRRSCWDLLLWAAAACMHHLPCMHVCIMHACNRSSTPAAPQPSMHAPNRPPTAASSSPHRAQAANVLLASRPGGYFGVVSKVSDFGLSRVLSAGATHRSTGTLGTITHQPPELLRLGKMSPAGDVYAFGILMW